LQIFLNHPSQSIFVAATPSDLIKRKPLSIALGLCEPAGVEAGLGERARSLKETLLGLRAAKECTILGSFRLAPLALL
jgi:hypothetical protein